VWQIDWVNYDESVCSLVAPATGLHPRAEVFVVDTKNANPLLRCYNVTPFFSFEEAYCYFCWDTADRVTSGSIKSSQTSDICLGTSACSLSGSGTTQFYLKIKFNNYSEGAFGNFFLNSWYSSANCAVTFTPVSVDKWLNFSVDGVVKYPWTIKNIGGSAGSLFVPMGTMTMGTANGYANNPYCGVLTGSIKITETTDSKLPVACRKHDLSEYIP
jgi:hypothetical protein